MKGMNTKSKTKEKKGAGRKTKEGGKVRSNKEKERE
jgi:hypothetical protein